MWLEVILKHKLTFAVCTAMAMVLGVALSSLIVSILNAIFGVIMTPLGIFVIFVIFVWWSYANYE